VGPFVVTQDFGDAGNLFVLGVAYTDRDNDEFYSIGEGRGDLTVTWGNSSVKTYTTGGYSLEIDSGKQVFTLTGGGLSGAVRVEADISENLKIDIVNGDTLLTSGSVTVNGPVKVIKAIGSGDSNMRITGGDGDETLIGTADSDFISGRDGNDIIKAGGGNDTLNGGNGNDELHGGDGDDTIDGGTGNDVVVFDGDKKEFVATALSGGTIRITRGSKESDAVVNVETFRFDDGDYVWSASQNKLILATPANQAPVVDQAQFVSTNEDTAKQITVSATDPNGDTLTYVAGVATSGIVTGGAGGVFTYTPAANFSGSDSFTVTVSDGKGGTATHVVNVAVLDVNEAPVVAASQTVSTNEDTPIAFRVTATDPDGDTLSYVAGTAGHGTVSGGANGIFNYTPDDGFTGTDSFVVAVSDGNGGSSSQTVTVTIGSDSGPPPPSAPVDLPAFRLFASDGFTGSTGGSGFVYGSNDFQDVSFSGAAGSIQFDASYNRGGDIIRLPGDASEYTIMLEGSSALIGDGDTLYTLPVGTVGSYLVFDDGARKLYYDAASQSVKIGSQSFDDTPALVTAPAQTVSLPTGADDSAVGRVFLDKEAETSLGGDLSVFGTSEGEYIEYLGGNMTFDASFNRGGDELAFNNIPSVFSAYLQGSNLILISEDGDLSIPVGTKGLTLDFEGVEYSLRFDSSAGEVMIGTLAITATTRETAQQLDFSGQGGTGGGQSIDVGDGATTVDVTLDDGVAYTLTDSAAKNTNVVIEGFDGDDVIKVTGATANQYNFGSMDADGDQIADDLSISFNANGVVTLITLIDVVSPNSFVYSHETAMAAVGHEFITFG
jgi:VCBS repeat-containing protein